MAEIISDLFRYFGLWAVPIGITLYILFFPDRAKILSAWIWDIASKIRKDGQYKAIGYELEGNIGVFITDLNKEMSGVKMKTPKIQFVQEETRQAFIEKNRVIIKLKPKDDQDYNFAVASYLFVKQTTIPTAKKALSENFGEAIDLFMGRKFLEKRRRTALDSYLEEFYLPQVRNNEGLQKILEEFESIDDYGLFSRILLQELLFLEKSVVGKSNITKLENEFINLKNFVLAVVNRKVGQHIELFFEGGLTNTAIILVAISMRRQTEGTTPYVNRFGKNIENGANHIYFISWDKHNKFLGQVVDEVNQKYSNAKLIKISKHKIVGSNKWYENLRVASYAITNS